LPNLQVFKVFRESHTRYPPRSGGQAAIKSALL
jgi:hypothetical protein